MKSLKECGLVFLVVSLMGWFFIFVDGWSGGHNAMPLADGQCCTECNNTKVIRARLEGHFK